MLLTVQEHEGILMHRYLIICGAIVTAGCAKQQPPIVAAVPTPAPTVKPLPTQKPIVIQSNEPPPPAMFRMAPQQSFQQPRTRRAPRVAQQQSSAGLQEDSQPSQTPRQILANATPAALFDTIGNDLQQAQTPEEIQNQLGLLAEMHLFYRKQRNNPTMMNRQRANSNVIITETLESLANKKLRLISDLVPVETQGVEKTQLSLGFERARTLSRSMP